NWLIFSTPVVNGRTIISSFIEAGIDKVNRPLLKESLPQWEAAKPSVGRVHQINRPGEIIFQPIESEELIKVHIFEKDRSLEEDSLLVGILVPLGEAYTFFATFIDIDPEETEEIVEIIEEMVD